MPKDADYERIASELRLANHLKKKRLYEQAKRVRKTKAE